MHFFLGLIQEADFKVETEQISTERLEEAPSLLLWKQGRKFHCSCLGTKRWKVSDCNREVGGRLLPVSRATDRHVRHSTNEEQETSICPSIK